MTNALKNDTQSPDLATLLRCGLAAAPPEQPGLLQHVGLDGAPQSLAALGRGLGLTRERMRQIVQGQIDALAPETGPLLRDHLSRYFARAGEPFAPMDDLVRESFFAGFARFPEGLARLLERFGYTVRRVYPRRCYYVIAPGSDWDILRPVIFAKRAKYFLAHRVAQSVESRGDLRVGAYLPVSLIAFQQRYAKQHAQSLLALRNQVVEAFLQAHPYQGPDDFFLTRRRPGPGVSGWTLVHFMPHTGLRDRIQAECQRLDVSRSSFLCTATIWWARQQGWEPDLPLERSPRGLRQRRPKSG